MHHCPNTDSVMDKYTDKAPQNTMGVSDRLATCVSLDGALEAHCPPLDSTTDRKTNNTPGLQLYPSAKPAMGASLYGVLDDSHTLHCSHAASNRLTAIVDPYGALVHRYLMTNSTAEETTTIKPAPPMECMLESLVLTSSSCMTDAVFLTWPWADLTGIQTN